MQGQDMHVVLPRLSPSKASSWGEVHIQTPWSVCRISPSNWMHAPETFKRLLAPTSRCVGLASSAPNAHFSKRNSVPATRFATRLRMPTIAPNKSRKDAKKTPAQDNVCIRSSSVRNPRPAASHYRPTSATKPSMTHRKTRGSRRNPGVILLWAACPKPVSLHVGTSSVPRMSRALAPTTSGGDNPTRHRSHVGAIESDYARMSEV